MRRPKDLMDAPFDRKMSRLAKTGGKLPATPAKKTVKTGGTHRPMVRIPVPIGGVMPPSKTFNTAVKSKIRRTK